MPFIIGNHLIRLYVKIWCYSSQKGKEVFIKKYGHISHWNVSYVTDMSKLFKNNEYFNEYINNWDVSNVKDMSEMFSGAIKYNMPLDKWDVSKVTNMDGMFYGAERFNQPIKKWNVSKVISMEAMFCGAENFNQSVNLWNISKVTNMGCMFMDATNFNQPFDPWDFSNVTNIGGMFYGATSFCQNIFGWNIWDIPYVGFNRSNIELKYGIIIKPMRMWNIKNETNMKNMFSNEPLNNWNYSNVIDMQSIFSNTALFNLIHNCGYTKQELLLMSNLDIKKMLDHAYFYFEYRKDIIMFLIYNGFRYINEHYNRTVTITKQTIHPSIEAVFGNEDLTRIIAELVYS